MNMLYEEEIRHEMGDAFWKRLIYAEQVQEELNRAEVNPEDYDNKDPFSDLISDLEYYLNVTKHRKIVLPLTKPDPVPEYYLRTD